jgi:hypothetical protein
MFTGVLPNQSADRGLAREFGGRFEDTSWLEQQSAGSLSPNSGHKTAWCHNEFIL